MKRYWILPLLLLCAYGCRSKAPTIAETEPTVQEEKAPPLFSAKGTQHELSTEQETESEIDPKNQITLDKVIVSSSFCFGNCPVHDILLTRQGELLFYGEQHNTHNGYRHLKLSAELWEKIEALFLAANYATLDDNYTADISDNQTITVTFVQGTKIVKTITDYASRSPKSFQDAYTAVRHIPEQQATDTLAALPFYLNLHHIAIKQESDICDLTRSESFYLWSLLRDAKKTTQTHEGKYLLRYSGAPEVAAIKSDGRYFTFRFKKGTPETLTLDIGFNFMESNAELLQKRWREKTQYE